MCNLIFRCLCVSYCLVLGGCNLPLVFWEEEAREIVDDIVDEEEKLQGRPYNPKRAVRTP